MSLRSALLTGSASGCSRDGGKHHLESRLDIHFRGIDHNGIGGGSQGSIRARGIPRIPFLKVA